MSTPRSPAEGPDLGTDASVTKVAFVEWRLVALCVMTSLSISMGISPSLSSIC